jgi:predicted DNA-binding transcriptional regulator AlpA
MLNNPPNRTYLTRKEASEYTGFSSHTLAKWAASGKGPKFRKFGAGRSARVRYSLPDLDAFLAGNSEAA